MTAIVKNSFQPPMPEIGSDYGQIVDDDGFHMQWMVRKPALDFVLQSFSCSLKKLSCKTCVCSCSLHGLQCTQVCQCLNCENQKKDEDRDLSDDQEDESIETSNSEEETEEEEDVDRDEENI